MKYYITFLAVLFFLTSNMYSQIDVEIYNVYFEGESMPDCDEIHLYAQTYNYVSFDVKVTRPWYDNDPNLYASGELLIAYSNGGGEEIEDTIPLNHTMNWVILEDEFQAYLEFSVDINLPTSLFNGDSGAFYARFDESGSNFFKESCEYDIIMPEFSITPDDVEISCGDASEVTFSVNNFYNTPNVGYDWSYTGWTFVEESDDSITLIPNSSTSLPSNVTVTPIYGGHFPDSTSEVIRGDYSSEGVILGSGGVCSAETYIITGLNSDESVSSWYLSDTSIASISYSGNQATITPVGQGLVTIYAVIENTCG